jgi:hypothetical protein
MIIRSKIHNSILTVFLIAVTSVFFAACQAKDLPFLKEEAERRRREENKRVEKAIEESSVHRELDMLCRELPPFKRLDPISKSIGKHSVFLSYYYNLNQNFSDVKRALNGYFDRKGWQLKSEDNGFVGDSIVFQNDSYLIEVTHQDFDDANYSITCKLLKK